MKKLSIPLGVKIFGLALSMLLLLIAIASFSYSKLNQVKNEMVNLTEYIIPIADTVALVDIHILEQKVHLSRKIRLLSTKPLDEKRIKYENEQVTQRREEIYEELSTTIDLVHKAAHDRQNEKNKAEMEKIEALLTNIRKDYLQFSNDVTQLSDLWRQGKRQEVKTFFVSIGKKEDSIYEKTETIRQQLQKFRLESAQLTKNHQNEVLRVNWSVTLMALVVGILFASALTTKLVRPIRYIRSAMSEVKDGNLNVHLERTSSDEMGSLVDSFNHMLSELVIKEQIQEAFGKYVDPRVVENLVSSDTMPKTGGEKQVMTISFGDVDSFSDVAEKLTPEELVHWTNEYLTLMAEPVSTHHGVIDKFIDTMVMAFWGEPFTNEEEHAQLACFTALEQIGKLEEFKKLLPQASHLKLYVGIASGSVVVGNMGSEQSKSYTVLGDTVNTSSRLKGTAKQYGVPIIISESTQEMAASAIESREIDLIKVVGKEEPIRIFEVLAAKGDIDKKTSLLRECFRKGVDAYRKQDWEDALVQFKTCLEINPHDAPSAIYEERIKKFQSSPPGEDWDGVWSLSKK